MYSIDILYGSTTGNTQDLAETIALKLKSSATTISCNNVININSLYNLTSNINIWCCSTWGIDPACLQEDFENFITNNLNKSSIENAQFLIFGVGDKYYPYFAESANILEQFVVKNKGKLLITPLKIQDPWENEISLIDKYLLNFINNYIV